MKKRKVDIVVISDLHLGTYGCDATRLLKYLKSINPKKVILNGDIIDIWQFSKRYFPSSHMKVVKHLIGLVSKNVPVYYVTGNHDEMLRKFSGMQLGSLQIVDKIVLDLPQGQKAWVFHGDIFDVTMQHSKWLAKLGAVGYDTLILINKMANFISERIFKKGKLSFSKRIKNSVKGAVKFINSFEQTAANIGIRNKYDYVICGHIHQPEIRQITSDEGSITYLNSGDWIENLSALEFSKGQWSLYRYDDKDMQEPMAEQPEDHILPTQKLFENMVVDFKLMAIK